MYLEHVQENLCVVVNLNRSRHKVVTVPPPQLYSSAVFATLCGHEPGQSRFNSGEDDMAEKTAASTGLIPGLSRTDVLNIIVLIPDIDEQTASAEVLSDMDAEITALEQKRDKTKLIKQGMMQELLTGKIRLV